MKIFFTHVFVFLLSSILLSAKPQFDLTLVGYTEYADGIGRIPIGIFETLKNDLKINLINTRKPKENNDQLKVITAEDDNFETNISLLTDVIFHKAIPTSKLIPKKSKIKISYSMFEASRIPNVWVRILNQEFDAVIVPDKYLVSVYEKSGVKIPIFVVPIGLYLDRFFKEQRKTNTNNPFVFGTTVGFHERKNHELLIKSFIEEFGKTKDVILKINGRPYGKNDAYYKAKEIVKQYPNIIIDSNILSEDEYLNFMKSLDCFINISKGEGFSITPRESLTLGIPCIITNNTAQITICESGFVKSINSPILEPAYYKQYSENRIGCFFNCNKVDVKRALRDVYNNYNYYLNLAKNSIDWVKSYTWQKLKPLYINIVKPKKLILGKINLITKDFLMTNSIDLYYKYLNLNK